MEQEAIEDLHDFDRDWFKSQRRYITHLVDLAEDTAVEAILQASTGTFQGTSLCLAQDLAISG